MENVAKRARLWNRGNTDYKQIVNGSEVYIPAGKSVECSRHEAVTIRGHYCGKGVPVRLEIELLYDEKPKKEKAAA